MTRPDVPATLAEALVALQADLPVVPKSQKARVATQKGTYEYSYASLAAVSAALLPKLGSVGLAFVACPTLLGERFVLACELVHVSGERLQANYPLMVPSSAPAQAIGSAITYGRRYALTAMTGLVCEDDDDAAAASAATAPRPARSRQRAEPRTDDPNHPDDPNGPAGRGRGPGGPARPVTDPMFRRLHALFNQAGMVDRNDRLAYSSAVVGRDVASSTLLDFEEIRLLMRTLEEGLAEQHQDTPS